MKSRPLLPTAGIALATAVTLILAGCAGLKGPPEPPFKDPTLSIPRAQALLVPGQSTRSDVTAMLGPANVVIFESGFEVWAYRTKPAGGGPASAELVILFGPSGVVRKTRVRS